MNVTETPTRPTVLRQLLLELDAARALCALDAELPAGVQVELTARLALARDAVADALQLVADAEAGASWT